MGFLEISRYFLILRVLRCIKVPVNLYGDPLCFPKSTVFRSLVLIIVLLFPKLAARQALRGIASKTRTGAADGSDTCLQHREL